MPMIGCVDDQPWGIPSRWGCVDTAQLHLRTCGTHRYADAAGRASGIVMTGTSPCPAAVSRGAGQGAGQGSVHGHPSAPRSTTRKPSQEDLPVANTRIDDSEEIDSLICDREPDLKRVSGETCKHRHDEPLRPGADASNSSITRRRLGPTLRPEQDKRADVWGVPTGQRILDSTLCLSNW